MLLTIACLQALHVRIADAAEEGQGLAEYGLILALVAVACLVALGLLGANIGNLLTSVAGHL